MNKLLLILCIFMTNSCFSALPQRQDCILKVDVKWDDSDKLNKNEYFENFMETYYRVHTAIFSESVNLPSMAAHLERNVFYLQYLNSCENKYDIYNRVIESFPDEMVPTNIFFISNDVVQASPDTIDVKGPYWSN